MENKPYFDFIELMKNGTNITDSQSFLPGAMEDEDRPVK
jgi:hypothetical protein